MLDYERIIASYDFKNNEELTDEEMDIFDETTEYVEFEGCELTIGKCLYKGEERYFIVEGHIGEVYLLKKSVTKENIDFLIKLFNYDLIEE